MDGDGKADIVIFDDTGVFIIYGTGRSNFEIRGSLLKINNNFNPA